VKVQMGGMKPIHASEESHNDIHREFVLGSVIFRRYGFNWCYSGRIMWERVESWSVLDIGGFPSLDCRNEESPRCRVSILQSLVYIAQFEHRV
jgi:hypothetical protein